MKGRLALKKGSVIKYLPSDTPKEEITKLRQEFNYQNHNLILIISGKDNLLDNLCEFIKARKL